MQNDLQKMENEPTAVICFLGDIFLGNTKPRITAALAEVLQDSDHRIANLETPISEPAPIDSNKILLRSSPGCETILQELGIDVVSVANNHIFDHGKQGFEATRNALDNMSIQYVGAGDDIVQASTPLLFEIHGIRFGLIAATEEGTQALIAQASSCGCNTLEQGSILRQ
ncbi:MAG: CapA family protein, partial [Planctomycetia bacterium]